MPEITRSSMLRIASEFPKGSDGRKALLERVKKARPVSIKDAEVMLYMIDTKTNKSKFYEMRVVPAGRESNAKKEKVWTGRGWVLERRWGRLTDEGGITGRTDSYNDFFADQDQAQRMMGRLKGEKTRKGYQDVSRKREYPIGLGSAGFGWGGQSVCRVIPELQSLLSHVQDAKGELRGLAREENSVAMKLKGWLDPMESYLIEQLSHCR
jgi:predicted DNA-binding WGR domain protein